MRATRGAGARASAKAKALVTLAALALLVPAVVAMRTDPPASSGRPDPTGAGNSQNAQSGQPATLPNNAIIIMDVPPGMFAAPRDGEGPAPQVPDTGAAVFGGMNSLLETRTTPASRDRTAPTVDRRGTPPVANTGAPVSSMLGRAPDPLLPATVIVADLPPGPDVIGEDPAGNDKLGRPPSVLPPGDDNIFGGLRAREILPALLETLPEWVMGDRTNSGWAPNGNAERNRNDPTMQGQTSEPNVVPTVVAMDLPDVGLRILPPAPLPEGDRFNDVMEGMRYRELFTARDPTGAGSTVNTGGANGDVSNAAGQQQLADVRVSRSRPIIFDFPPGYFGVGGTGGNFRLINPNSHPANPMNLNPFDPNLPKMGVVMGRDNDLTNLNALSQNQNNPFPNMRFRRAAPAPAGHESFALDRCVGCEFSA